MKLSVIIVNYNVKHFLEQCLHSVQKACNNIDSEILVVDNNSVDGSCSLVKDKFPEVILLENKTNVGFSIANNQAIKQAKGEYILLLNPDTVVEEDTFAKVLEFMDKTPNAGALGIKMIDGKGNFLPESKRGLPTPLVAFYKIFGLSKLFPKNKKFGAYHLSYLNNDKIHKVDVLSGAFMLLRKTVLNKVGLLDEGFFMYGEDIDLSYRITLAGYENYYFPETTIIHYKGESTKKNSVNYIRIFYNAMIIFSNKHFTGNNARLFALLINLAIYFRAFMAIANRVFAKIYLPVFDALLIYLGYLFISPYWENFKYYAGYYPEEFYRFAVPTYILFWLGGIIFSGGYKIPNRLWTVIRGLVWGTIAILLAYSLVDENYRFSRALILLGSGWALFALSAIRIIFHKIRLGGFHFFEKKPKRIAIIGHPEEAKRVTELLSQTEINSEIIGYVTLNDSDFGNQYLGSIDNLDEIIRINKISELIFCAEDISSGKIIKSMLEHTKLQVDYKIAPPESLSIIGSNSIHTAGDLYVVNINSISKIKNRRLKRAFDVFFSLLLLLSTPISIWFFLDKAQLFKNIFNVINASLSWVGYIPEKSAYIELPNLKNGILNPGELFDDLHLDLPKKSQLNLLYARDYKLATDLEIIFKSRKKLSRKL